jgi:hypothetical protein
VPEAKLQSDQGNDDLAEKNHEWSNAIQLLRPKRRGTWAKALVLGSVAIAASTQVTARTIPVMFSFFIKS